MKITILLFTLLVVLLGCSSEVDKCVNSQLKAWTIDKKEAQARLDAKKQRSMLYELWDDVEITTMSKEKFEADARLKCMKAASKVE